jgi:hypothetical protein
MPTATLVLMRMVREMMLSTGLVADNDVVRKIDV